MNLLAAISVFRVFRFFIVDTIEDEGVPCFLESLPSDMLNLVMTFCDNIELRLTSKKLANAFNTVKKSEFEHAFLKYQFDLKRDPMIVFGALQLIHADSRKSLGKLSRKELAIRVLTTESHQVLKMGLDYLIKIRLKLDFYSPVLRPLFFNVLMKHYYNLSIVDKLVRLFNFGSIEEFISNSMDNVDGLSAKEFGILLATKSAHDWIITYGDLDLFLFLRLGTE